MPSRSGVPLPESPPRLPGASPDRGDGRAGRINRGRANVSGTSRRSGFSIDRADGHGLTYLTERAAALRLHNLRAPKPPDTRTAFQGVDVWRWQYFKDVPCPPGVIVPVDDPTAWRLFPEYHTLYDKRFICESQGVPCGPHGTMPDRFPVFSKPIMNLHGMGMGGRTIHSAAELEAHFTPGHMWMALHTGRHVSTDVAVAGGRPRWWRHTVGKPLEGGMFDYWTVHAGPRPVLEASLSRWIAVNLKGFTGIINFETIGGTITECHQRMSEQWLDLNGPGWLGAVVDLYAGGRRARVGGWRFAVRPRTGYSVVLFGPRGPRYWIDPEAVAALRARPGVSSIQITFDPFRPPEQHAMPPGGFRLAIVNCWNLPTGLAVRAQLRRRFMRLSGNGKFS